MPGPRGFSSLFQNCFNDGLPRNCEPLQKAPPEAWDSLTRTADGRRGRYPWPEPCKRRESGAGRYLKNSGLAVCPSAPAGTMLLYGMSWSFAKNTLLASCTHFPCRNIHSNFLAMPFVHLVMALHELDVQALLASRLRVHQSRQQCCSRLLWGDRCSDGTWTTTLLEFSADAQSIDQMCASAPDALPTDHEKDCSTTCESEVPTWPVACISCDKHFACIVPSGLPDRS